MRRFRTAGWLARFAGDRRGNFAVVTAAVSSVLALGVGLGINTAQVYSVRSNLRNALDAAVTSTARDLTTGKVTEANAPALVRAFLLANADAGALNSANVVLDRLLIDKPNNTVEATAHVDVALFIPFLGSQSDRRIVVDSAALYSAKSIEVAMMLDITGSMGGQKIKDLKTAANNAIDAFLSGQDPANPRVRVALIPYSNSVNAGSLAASSVFVERKVSERTDAPGNEDALDASASTKRPDNCATERKGAQQYTDAAPSVAMVNRDLMLTDFGKLLNTSPCPVAAIAPLSADANALKAVVKTFNAEGGTGGHIGVQWTWYMLSEKWGGVMKKSERPAKTDPKKVAKYAILMTDGEFNLSYFDVSQVTKVYNDHGKEATRTAAKKLCQEMRKAGIEIFTIGFKLENSDAKETMKDCASPDTSKDRHYYEVADGTALNNAYQDIARNIERLALTK